MKKKEDDWFFETTPPTEAELFDQFCYEMYMKHKDEVYAWERKIPSTTSEEYISKNKSLLRKEFKRMNKKGNL